MAIPTYQELMYPVLEACRHGEVCISDVINELAEKLDLSEEDKAVMIPSGKQSRFANRTHWAKSYLKQAGLVKFTKRAHFTITERGKEALKHEPGTINNEYLARFDEFKKFKTRRKLSDSFSHTHSLMDEQNATPDEALREAHARINETLSNELLERVKEGSPAFFEQLIVDLLLAMGYGGSSEEAGRALGQSGDNGVDGVIDQDPLGVDQIYVQAKRYAANNGISAGAIRDFYGALNLHRAQKGIFVTTSYFTNSAKETAQNLGMRIVLIDGERLSKLMIRYNIGCRDQDILHIKKISEDFFED